MLSFESSLSNTADDSGDDDDDLSRFLLGLATSHATLGGSWVLDFHHWWYSSSRQSLLASINCLLRHAGEHSGSILLSRNRRGSQVWPRKYFLVITFPDLISLIRIKYRYFYHLIFKTDQMSLCVSIGNNLFQLDMLNLCCWFFLQNLIQPIRRTRAAQQQVKANLQEQPNDYIQFWP